ncbi:hypothetical protein UJ101_01255 [Flavobacteriaceae bacterium UJ101]|nr:hypothetical protein UJ101_01255 [Flavobacteriaceae bacterium UJ101]
MITYKSLLHIFILTFYTISYAQVKISTSTLGSNIPHESTILDMVSTNKGVSIPNIGLTNEHDSTTIKNPKKGLMVYHPGHRYLAEGVYYNSKDSKNPLWVKIEALSSYEGTPYSKNLGPHDNNRTVTLDHIEFRLIRDSKDNRLRPQIKSTTGADLKYSVIAKQFWLKSGRDNRSTRASTNQTLSTSFQWISEVDSLRDDLSELNDIWIYITTPGKEGTYRYTTNVVLINGITETSQILKKY